MGVGSLLMMASQAAFTFEMIIVGRVLVGIACGAYTGIAPVYLSEIAPVSIRGASGIMHQLAIVSAILISQILGLRELMGTAELWPYLLGLSVIPSVVLLLTLWICPDSPRYILLNTQDTEGARSALRWFRSDPSSVDEEIQELLSEQEAQSEHQSVILKSLSVNTIRLLEICSQGTLPVQGPAFGPLYIRRCSPCTAILRYQCGKCPVSSIDRLSQTRLCFTPPRSMKPSDLEHRPFMPLWVLVPSLSL